MKVLVIGAHGNIGKQLVNKLKNSPHPPVAMLRKQEQVDEYKSKGIETVLADLEEDFEHAFENVDAVVFTAGSGGSTGPEKTHLIDRKGAIKAVDFAIKNKVDRFIMVSAFGADFPPAEWPDDMKTYYEAKSDADEHLMQTELDWTIVKPGMLTDENGTNSIEIGELISQREGSVTRTDVATVLEKVLDKENTYKKTLELMNGKMPIDDAIEAL